MKYRIFGILVFLPGVPKKANKLEKHSSARKHDKSPKYNLLERKISKLIPNLSKSNEKLTEL